jgi:outer membrane protein OmpA-like peptidoglycan-associated protein
MPSTMLLLFAAAQAAAAPAPLMIFFDSGKSEIRREWEPVLDEAAKAASGGARLILVGHTDRPGSAAGNRRMSLARAKAVAAALEARGVAASAIEVTGEGEDNPYIATADGVREIQNRRVDIRVAP